MKRLAKNRRESLTPNRAMNLSWKKTTNTLESDKSQDYKASVAAYQRKCQRVPKEKLIFLDGTGMNVNLVDFMGWHQRERKQELSLRSRNATNLGLIFGVPYPTTSRLR